MRSKDFIKANLENINSRIKLLEDTFNCFEIHKTFIDNVNAFEDIIKTLKKYKNQLLQNLFKLNVSTFELKNGESLNKLIKEEDDADKSKSNRTSTIENIENILRIESIYISIL